MLLQTIVKILAFDRGCTSL